MRKDLDAAIQREEERHDEVRDALEHMSTAVTSLANAISTDSESRNKQQSELISALTTLASQK